MTGDPATGGRSAMRDGLLALSSALLASCTAPSQPLPRAENGLDLSQVSDTELRRVYGATGDGSLGLAVAGGADMDGDGILDTAFAAMQASPNGVARAGQVYLVLGDGALSGALDSAEDDARIFRINGAVPFEYAGSELWMDDVTGDGMGDLLIARQNYTLPGEPTARVAAGALSVLVGHPGIRQMSERFEALDLGNPSPELTLLTLVGADAGSRLGIWMRTGDITGDGIADVVLGADQDDKSGSNAGAVYVIAGGPHLALSATIDLAASGASVLAGSLLELTPPRDPSPANYHFGATCQIADLDGNGKGEVLVAAALSRAGAVLDAFGGTGAAGSGGSRRGSTFIVWDDNFPETPWPSDFSFAVDAGAGAHSVLEGSRGNGAFGEELLGGLDWDLDGAADLFIGDLTANLSGRPDAGSSHIIYDARRLKGLHSDIAELGTLEPPIRTTTISGARPGDIHGDTAAQGDFSGDGVADLAVCSPHASPLGRHSAGTIHILHGRAGGWPTRIDLGSVLDTEALSLVELYGAHGTFGTDRGDTLCYSAAAGDLDGDSLTDLIVNEMVGNGLGPGSVNVGNLVLLGGPILNRGDLDNMSPQD